MKLHTLYTEEQVAAAVRRVATDIERHFGDSEQVIALCLLNGALWYAADLLRCLPCNFELQGFIHVDWITPPVSRE